MSPPITSMPDPSGPTAPNPIWFEEDDTMRFSLRVLRELFSNVDHAQLPSDLAACLAGDTRTIEANNNAFRVWENDNEARRGLLSLPPDQAAAPTNLVVPPLTTPSHATSNQTLPSTTTRIATRQAPPPTIPPRPAGHASVLAHAPTVPTPTTTVAPAHTPTVHRTSSSELVRGTFPLPDLPDLSLRVCSNLNNPQMNSELESPWEPHTLFPELRAQHASAAHSTLLANRVHLSRPPETVQPDTSTALHRTANTKIRKKSAGSIKLDAQAFVDIPLTYIEGRQLLDLIGANSISLPPNLMNTPNETGPSSPGPINQTIQRRKTRRAQKPIQQTQPSNQSARPSKSSCQIVLVKENTPGSSAHVAPPPRKRLSKHPCPPRPTSSSFPTTISLSENDHSWPDDNNLDQNNDNPSS